MHSRSHAAVVTAALLLLAPAATQAKGKPSKEAKLRKARVAVLDFPASPGAFGCGVWNNSERRMAGVLRELFTTELDEAADGEIRIVERERIDDVRGELKFQQSGEVDAATVQKAGKLLGVRYLLTGKMTRFTCKVSGANTGWGVGALVGRATGSSMAGRVAGSASTKSVAFEGRLDARLIDTKTGEILGTFKDEEEASDRSVKIAGGGNDVAYDDGLASEVFEPIAKRQAPKIVKKLLRAHEENLEEDEEEAEASPSQEDGARVARAGGSDDGEEGGSGSAGPGGSGGGSEGAGRGSGSAASAAQVYSNEFDFVPGDNVLFFDDFSDTDVGDSPIRFKGSGLTVVEADGRRWLSDLQTSCGSGKPLRLDIKGDLPQKFTVEFDALFGEAAYVFMANGGRMAGAGWAGVVVGGKVVNSPPAPGVHHVAVSVNDTYVKLYIDGKRVQQHTDGVKRPIKTVGVCIWGKSQDSRRLFTSLKIAEGGKDYATELTSLGRIVTHGITFDSGSDRIRPESGPTLRKILKLLQDDSSLSFEVEGHTDNQGGDKVNGPLSERRAAAVKGWLVSQGIEDGRLAAKGLGASKPLEPNDTPEGRANNRRVEFAKR